MDYSNPTAATTPSNYAAPAPYNASFPTQSYPSNPSYFGGTMDTAVASSGTPAYMSTPSTFIPAAPQADLQGYDLENEPPLLEELGVNWEHILMKTKAVVIPFRRFQQHSALTDPNIICGDADLAGPLVYALLLGGELLVTGKLQFGYIYGFGLFGCLSMTLILNLMSTKSISFWTVTSILGYALIPVNLLAALKIVFFSFGSLVRLFALITVVWSTTASTRLLEIGFGLADQRYLLAYPIALLYSAFVLITIF
jgi:protein YIPF5/7